MLVTPTTPDMLDMGNNEAHWATIRVRAGLRCSLPFLPPDRHAASGPAGSGTGTPDSGSSSRDQEALVRTRPARGRYALLVVAVVVALATLSGIVDARMSGTDNGNTRRNDVVDRLGAPGGEDGGKQEQYPG